MRSFTVGQRMHSIETKFGGLLLWPMWVIRNVQKVLSFDSSYILVLLLSHMHSICWHLKGMWVHGINLCLLAINLVVATFI